MSNGPATSPGEITRLLSEMGELYEKRVRDVAKARDAYGRVPQRRVERSREAERDSGLCRNPGHVVRGQVEPDPEGLEGGPFFPPSHFHIRALFDGAHANLASPIRPPCPRIASGTPG